MQNIYDLESIRSAAYLDELEKIAFLGKVFPKKIGNVPAFPTFRKGIAGGIRMIRRSADKLPKKTQKMAKSAIRDIFTKPDVAAVYAASTPAPVPSLLVAGAYAAGRKKILSSIAKKQ